MTESLLLYSTQEHNCSYLPDRQATTLFVDPSATLNPQIYDHLLSQGFRRSGNYIYRPHCNMCQTCIPLRLPVDNFNANRSQRRVWSKNEKNLTVTTKPVSFLDEHFDLYCRYMQSRHPDGDMANPSTETFHDFLTSNWSETEIFEFHIRERLLAIAVTDLLPSGLSAVYTFFEPELSQLSPGVLALLWQIQENKRRQLPWLYLGYWIPNCNKMNYKAHYRPLELFSQGQWREFSKNEEIRIPEMD